MRRRLSPPFLYKLFIVLMLLTLLFPLPGNIHFPFNLFGTILLVSGSYMAIATKKMFKRTQTPVSHRATPVKLHTEGIFRYTRNPMYLGITIGLCGIAIITGIIYNLLFPTLFLILMDFYFVRQEEKELNFFLGTLIDGIKKRRDGGFDTRRFRETVFNNNQHSFGKALLLN